MWNSTWPDGTKSVKQNETPGAQNTAYTETTLNLDHYWNIGTNEDGRHKQVNMPTNGADVTVATGMAGVVYIKTVASGNRLFYNDSVKPVQLPGLLSGMATITSTSTYATVATLKNDTYGVIYMWKTGNEQNLTTGHFKVSSSVVQAYSNLVAANDSVTASANLVFKNNDASTGLDLKARRGSGPNATYEYRVYYWYM